MVHPTPNGFVTHRHSTLRQQIFDVAQAQGEPEVKPYRLLNDLGRETIPAVADLVHPRAATRPPRTPQARSAVTMPSRALLGFGGNAWNAEATALSLHALFPHRDVVGFHYRGYAPSSGRPSARALFSDSLIIFDQLVRTQAGERIIPVGFSIGAAVAAYLGRHRPVAGLILVTPFDSLEALARDLYRWAPVGLLLRNRMPTIEFVRGSLAPTALIIAQHDAVVPARRSAPLRTAIRNMVFERAIDAGHNDLYDHPEFAAAAREALARVEAASGETPGR